MRRSGPGARAAQRLDGLVEPLHTSSGASAERHGASRSSWGGSHAGPGRQPNPCSSAYRYAASPERPRRRTRAGAGRNWRRAGAARVPRAVMRAPTASRVHERTRKRGRCVDVEDHPTERGTVQNPWKSAKSRRPDSNRGPLHYEQRATADGCGSITANRESDDVCAGVCGRLQRDRGGCGFHEASSLERRSGRVNAVVDALAGDGLPGATDGAAERGDHRPQRPFTSRHVQAGIEPEGVDRVSGARSHSRAFAPRCPLSRRSANRTLRDLLEQRPANVPARNRRFARPWTRGAVAGLSTCAGAAACAWGRHGERQCESRREIVIVVSRARACRGAGSPGRPKHPC
jgi:hypothetical protein